MKRGSGHEPVRASLKMRLHAVEDFLMTGLVPETPHRGDAVPAKQHTPQAVDLRARVDRVLVRLSCLASVQR